MIILCVENWIYLVEVSWETMFNGVTRFLRIKSKFIEKGIMENFCTSSLCFVVIHIAAPWFYPQLAGMQILEIWKKKSSLLFKLFFQHSSHQINWLVMTMTSSQASSIVRSREIADWLGINELSMSCKWKRFYRCFRPKRNWTSQKVFRLIDEANSETFPFFQHIRMVKLEVGKNERKTVSHELHFN